MSPEWWMAAGTLALVVITAIGLIVAWTKAVAKGEAAEKSAEKASNEAAKVRDELSAFKLHVAEKYTSTETMKEMEGRVVEAITRLGDRLDKAFEPRSAPRSRATKG